jgi:hypothetical protein
MNIENINNRLAEIESMLIDGMMSGYLVEKYEDIPIEWKEQDPIWNLLKGLEEEKKNFLKEKEILISSEIVRNLNKKHNLK